MQILLEDEMRQWIALNNWTLKQFQYEITIAARISKQKFNIVIHVLQTNCPDSDWFELHIHSRDFTYPLKAMLVFSWNVFVHCAKRHAINRYTY